MTSRRSGRYNLPFPLALIPGLAHEVQGKSDSKKHAHIWPVNWKLTLSWYWLLSCQWQDPSRPTAYKGSRCGLRSINSCHVASSGESLRLRPLTKEIRKSFLWNRPFRPQQNRKIASKVVATLTFDRLLLLSIVLRGPVIVRSLPQLAWQPVHSWQSNTSKMQIVVAPPTDRPSCEKNRGSWLPCTVIMRSVFWPALPPTVSTRIVFVLFRAFEDR